MDTRTRTVQYRAAYSLDMLTPFDFVGDDECVEVVLHPREELLQTSRLRVRCQTPGKNILKNIYSGLLLLR